MGASPIRSFDRLSAPEHSGSSSATPNLADEAVRVMNRNAVDQLNHIRYRVIDGQLYDRFVRTPPLHAPMLEWILVDALEGLAPTRMGHGLGGPRVYRTTPYRVAMALQQTPRAHRPFSGTAKTSTARHSRHTTD